MLILKSVDDNKIVDNYRFDWHDVLTAYIQSDSWKTNMIFPQRGRRRNNVREIMFEMKT